MEDGPFGVTSGTLSVKCTPQPPRPRETRSISVRTRLRAFRRGLKDAGYIESENVVIEYRWANGDNNRLAALAAELVGLRVNVLVSGTPVSRISPNLPGGNLRDNAFARRPV